MALRIAQRAFDRTLDDVQGGVIMFPINDGHRGLLRSSFQAEVGPLIPNTTALTHDDQEAIAEKTRLIFRHYRWVKPIDPRWEYVKTRMMKHMNELSAKATSGPATDADTENWAPPRPRSKHVKGEKVPCVLCEEEVIAPLDHLAYQHGIDTPKNRYTTRLAHIVKMHRDIVVQHLVQDGGELNRLQGEILVAEVKLGRLDSEYQSQHGLPLDVVYVTDRDHPSFAVNREQKKQALVIKLIKLREAGLRKGELYSGEGQGTYSQVLADLKQALAQEQ